MPVATRVRAHPRRETSALPPPVPDIARAAQATTPSGATVGAPGGPVSGVEQVRPTPERHPTPIRARVAVVVCPLRAETSPGRPRPSLHRVLKVMRLTSQVTGP